VAYKSVTRTIPEERMAIISRRGLGGWWWRGWAGAAAFLAVSMTPRVGVATEIQFPEPEALAPAVRFWAATFTQYGSRDVVIHDRLQPGLIYDVVRDVGSDDDPRVQAGIQAAVDRLERAARREPLAFALFAPRAATLEPAARVRTQRGLREAFAQGLTAERLFRPGVRRALDAVGLPLDLAALPLIESSYHPGRVSSAGAVGLWQLTADVADRYVRVDGKVDERRDPGRASVAAAGYLRDLHDQFGSWPLAITAYNHGPTGMQRARTTVGSDDLGEIVQRYDGPGFGFASRNFYAEFLAARHVLRHAGDYFPDTRPGRLVTYKVKRGDTLERVAKRHGVTIPSLRVMNGIRAALLRPGQMLLVRL
jgi:membrane-bound lytic murein transglycosylase D